MSENPKRATVVIQHAGGEWKCDMDASNAYAVARNFANGVGGDTLWIGTPTGVAVFPRATIWVLEVVDAP